MTEQERHLIEYIVLSIGFMVFSMLMFIFRYDKDILILNSVLVSCFYSLWGIIHHALEGRLTRSVALEYILISILVFALLITALGI